MGLLLYCLSTYLDICDITGTVYQTTSLSCVFLKKNDEQRSFNKHK